LVLFLSLGVSFAPKNFSADTLRAQRLRINKKKTTTEYENHKKLRIINSQLQYKIYCFCFKYKKRVY